MFPVSQSSSKTLARGFFFLAIEQNQNLSLWGIGYLMSLWSWACAWLSSTHAFFTFCFFSCDPISSLDHQIRREFDLFLDRVCIRLVKNQFLLFLLLDQPKTASFQTFLLMMGMRRGQRGSILNLLICINS